MADVVESKVTGIIQSLNGLEDDLDSLTDKVGDMKKQLTVKTLSEIDTLLEKTREMAMKAVSYTHLTLPTSDLV